MDDWSNLAPAPDNNLNAAASDPQALSGIDTAQLLTDLALAAALQQIVDELRNANGKSAGGTVGKAVSEREYVHGEPWATGDFKFTANGLGPGWLRCDGTYVRKDQYPELFFVLTGGFDGGAPDNLFQLPDTTDMPRPSGTAKGAWYVRT